MIQRTSPKLKKIEIVSCSIGIMFTTTNCDEKLDETCSQQGLIEHQSALWNMCGARERIHDLDATDDAKIRTP